MSIINFENEMPFWMILPEKIKNCQQFYKSDRLTHKFCSISHKNHLNYTILHTFEID